MADDRPEWAKELFGRIDQMEENLGYKLDKGFREVKDLLGQIGQVLVTMSGQMDRLLELTHQNQIILIDIRDMLRLGLNGRGGPTTN